jgi:hypothetical protein
MNLWPRSRALFNPVLHLSHQRACPLLFFLLQEQVSNLSFLGKNVCRAGAGSAKKKKQFCLSPLSSPGHALSLSLSTRGLGSERLGSSPHPARVSHHTPTAVTTRPRVHSHTRTHASTESLLFTHACLGKRIREWKAPHKAGGAHVCCFDRKKVGSGSQKGAGGGVGTARGRTESRPLPQRRTCFPMGLSLTHPSIFFVRVFSCYDH